MECVTLMVREGEGVKEGDREAETQALPLGLKVTEAVEDSEAEGVSEAPLLALVLGDLLWLRVTLTVALTVEVREGVRLAEAQRLGLAE
jgi:hypothetical protein